MIINNNNRKLIVKINDKVLTKEEYKLEDNSITFKTPPKPNDRISLLRENNGQTSN